MKNFPNCYQKFDFVLYFLYICSFIRIIFTLFWLFTLRMLYLSISSIPICLIGAAYGDNAKECGWHLLALLAIILLWIFIYLFSQWGKEHKFAKLCAVIAIAVSYVIDFISSFLILDTHYKDSCRIVSLSGFAICALAIFFYIKSNKEAKVFSLFQNL